MTNSMIDSLVYLRPGPGANLDQQLKDVEAYALREGFRIVKVFVESEGDERPVWKDVLAFSRERAVCGLLVWRLDRLDTQFHDVDSFLNFLSDLGDRKIEFASALDEIRTSMPAAAFVRAVGVAVHRFKSKVKGERVHRGLSRARSEGQHVGRPRERDDSLILSLRADGNSMQQIAEKLKISIGTVHAALSSRRPENGPSSGDDARRI